MKTTDAKRGTGTGMSNDPVVWLREKVTEAEKALKAREQMEATWRHGTDETWRAVACKMTPAQRLQEANKHARIAVKCRRDLEMFQTVLNIVMGV